MKNIYIAIILLFCSPRIFAQSHEALVKTLGLMPEKPVLKIDTLEKKRIDNFWRYKIEFLAEDTDTVFNTPKDYISAFVFVPDAAKQKNLPGIIAVHQDGNHNYLGYLETAGIAGDGDQHYGLELAKRGYIVMCPNRFLHGGRRRINNPDTLADVFEQADIAEQHWIGQLQLRGRNFIGKEVYDLVLATDVLCRMPNLDKKNIGAIGHSAGGYILPYFMLMDKRIKVGASSCGVFELIDFYAEDAIRKRSMLAVIPNLANVGRTSDYIGHLAPRPFLMTRGMYEWGNGNSKQQNDSKRHVTGTEVLDAEARRYYKRKNADQNLKTIYFDENGGSHSFPPKVKEEVYQWLDRNLK